MLLNLVILLLLGCAMFAAAEASLFSLSRSQLETLRLKKPLLYSKVRELIANSDELLSTIIIGNECLNITIATLMTGFLESNLSLESEVSLVLLTVLFSSILLLTFSEILPKVLAFRMPMLVASIVVYPMLIANKLLSPIRRIFLGVSSHLIGLFGIKPAMPAAIDEQDFLTLVEVGAESGSLERDEKDLIFNVFHFSDLSVSDIMTPWSSVFYVTDTMSVDEILDKVKKKTFSRVPVLSVERGKVEGILYTKSLLKLLISSNLTEQLKEPLKKPLVAPYIVSAHKKISKLFRELKLNKVHIALVVDEFGNHIGLISLEDILNALFQTQTKRKQGVLK